MKKTFILLTISLFSFSVSAQVEFLDKLAGTVFPALFNGIKEIKDAGTKNQKNTKAEETQTKFKKELAVILNKIDTKQGDLDAYNKLFDITGFISDNLGATKALSRQEFLDAIIESDYEKALTETCMNFDNYLNQVIKKYDELKKLDVSTTDSGLQANLSNIVKDMEDKIGDISNRIDRENNKPKSTMGRDNALAYLNALNRSETRDDLRDLASLANRINNEIESWIRSSSAHLANAKTNLSSLVE